MARQRKPRRKRHHYVPETYLQAWSDENDRVAMRLRGTSEAKVTATKNVAVESDLYTMRGTGGEPDDFLEKALGDMVDGPAADLLRRLGEGKCPSKRSSDRWDLSRFLAIQLARTPDHIDQVLFPTLVSEYTGTRPVSTDSVRSYLTDVHLGYPPSELEVRAATDLVNGLLNMHGTLPTREEALMIALRPAIENLAPILRDKAWSIEIDPQGRFITTDLPVSKYWYPANRKPYEGVGIANVDEIRFPVNPHRLLVMRPRYPQHRTVVPDDRISLVNQQVAARCYRMVITQPRYAASLAGLKLRDRPPALRFNIGPLIQEDEHGHLTRDGREVIHQYIDHEDD